MTPSSLSLAAVLMATAAAVNPPPARGDEPADPDAGVDDHAAPPLTAVSPPSKPVAFDKRWLDPFFSSGATRAAAERFRLDDWAGAAAGFAKALKTLPAPPKNARSAGANARATETLPATFMLAVAKENLEAWADAGSLFERLYDTYPKLAPWHAYHAARCRLRRGDATGALEWSSKVPMKTVPEAETILVRLDALTSLARWDDVATEAARFLDRFTQGPRRAEAQFHLAQAMEMQKRPAREAIAVYRRIWDEAPLEAWSKRADDRIAALAVSLPSVEAQDARTPTAADLLTRGLVFFDRNQNVEAENTFTAALSAPGKDAVIDCRARFYRAQSVFKERQRPRAIPYFTESEGACRTVGEKDLVVKALYQGARCSATAGDTATALSKYATIESEFPDHSYADDARLRAAEIATDAGDDAKAMTLLSALPSLYPKGDLVNEALFRVGFHAFQAGDHDRALAAFDENLSRIPHEEIWYAEGRAHYWKGRIYEKMAMTAAARAAYERAVREYPLSVYAYLALERMRASFPKEREALVRELHAGVGGKETLPIDPQPRAVYGEPGFARAVEFARMGLGTEARRELAFLGLKAPESRDAARAEKKISASDTDALWVTAVLLDRGRVFSASHAVPRYSLTSYKLSWPEGRGEAAWKIAYPRAYPELVDKECRANKVPPALQLAIMREESAFSPKIESFANAMGLTQMIIKTAQRFTDKRVTRELLFDPAQNLEVGSRFLAFLLDHFGHAVPLSISGYNAGEAAVDRWLKERGDRPLDEFMEMIPYDETRNYTKRVLSSFLTYAWLYDKKTPVPRLDFSLAGQPKGAAPTRQGRGAGKRF